MRYFKLIKDHNIFGVINDNFFRRYQKKHDIIILSPIESAEFIEYNNNFYWANWLKIYPLSLIQKINIFSIGIEEIDQEEYQILQTTLQSEKQIKEQIKEQQQQLLIQEKEKDLNLEKTEEQLKNPDETLQYVKKVKILELQHDNQKKITQGSDITLENGKTYHFSFDNMGLFNLIATMNAQQESQENISLILQKMNEFKQQCDSYCNNLIQQVQSLDNIKDINDIHYQKKEKGGN